MKNLLMTRKPLVAACAAAVLTGCLGGSGSGSSAPNFSSLVGDIQTLSNDPALVSGGNVLVEVSLSDSASAGNVVVELNGTDVTSAFALRAEDRFIGLVEGLDLGENTLLAYERDRPGASAELVVTNHPSHGPIFSGPQLDPWICAQPSSQTVEVENPRDGSTANANTRVSGLSTVADDNCAIPREVTYYYQPPAELDENGEPIPCNFTFTGAGACFVPWDADNPPADANIARFTNDRGDTVRSILAVERGALNRGIYSLAVFHDPEQPHHPADPQLGWNNKMVFTFGGSSGGSRFQSPAGTPNFNQAALEKGYMLVQSSLNDHGTNANHALGAETLMMIKEHVVETWGPIRYTVGTGGSGGAIVQLTMASSYPGLLDGLIPSL
ncbi:MAG: hypothetical protein EA348_13385, partial [Pseudomonadaceae bacterium]